jgi:hypothetical protein
MDVDSFSRVSLALNIWKRSYGRTNAICSSFVASIAINNDAPGTPDSYLSCVGGPPYDGIRCNLGGWGGKPGPLSLTAECS